MLKDVFWIFILPFMKLKYPKHVLLKQKQKKRAYHDFASVNIEQDEIEDESTPNLQKQKISALPQQPTDKLRVDLSQTSNLQALLSKPKSQINSFANLDDSCDEDTDNLFQYLHHEVSTIKQEVNVVKRMTSQLMNMVNGLANAKFTKEKQEESEDTPKKKKVQKNQANKRKQTQRGKSAVSKRGNVNEEKEKKVQRGRSAVPKRGKKK